MSEPEHVQESSLEQQLSRMSEQERAALLEGLDVEALLFDWQFRARPAQMIDAALLNWGVLILSGGRGSGKTIAGSQFIRAVDANPIPRTNGTSPLRFALVGRTSADVRDVMINGESGLLNIYPPSQRDEITWTPTRRELILPNGAIGTTFSAEEPDQLRGPQFHVTWGDELAAWKEKPGVDGLTAWDNCRIATRLGNAPQILATTTPKRTPAIRKLWRESQDSDTVLLRRMTTNDNPYLTSAYHDTLNGLYGGTTLGRQELLGELLPDVDGALLAAAVIDASRVPEIPSMTAHGHLTYLVGVDPSVASKPGDECGIITFAATQHANPTQRHGYVVADDSVRGSPGVWSAKVIDVVRRTAQAHPDSPAPVVIVEGNQGGDMVRTTLAEAAARANAAIPRVRVVSAQRAKRARAEPVIAAYERGRIHHVLNFPDLEDQLTTWTESSGYSPDRVDALVHVASAALFEGRVQGGIGPTAIHSASALSLSQAAARRSSSARSRILSSLPLRRRAAPKSPNVPWTD